VKWGSHLVSLLARKYETLFPDEDCAQIVPVKVKFFQTDPNGTKNDLKKGTESIG
jgi:hypothetical protein